MDYNKAALEMHESHHGKVGIVSKVEVKTRDDLSTAYTPGVAEPCRKIKEKPDDVYKYTFKSNMVAVVSNGTAVLGLGDIGPEAGLPVMEGKAVLFKEFGGVDAFPICIDAHDAASVIAACKAIAPTFGGINLEDIKSPECFEIEETLERELDIPVFHDDQHGTAIVVTAALINALRVVGKKMEDVHIVLNGPGAAGTAIIKMLMTAGAKDIVAVDQFGTLYKGCNSAEAHKNWLGEVTNPRQIKGGLKEALAGADVFIGVSKPGILTTELCKTMNKDAIVFAMANPTPEIMPDEAKAGDRYEILPGDRIPLDGTVVEGESFVDLSAITGESVPVHVAAGDELVSGGINKSGRLVAVAVHEAGESNASRIIRAVEEASESKPRMENFITRFARIYTPAVMVLTLLVAVIPPLMGLGEWKEWIHRGLLLLVISCPCALVLSVPLTFFAGLARQSSNGVMLKAANVMEMLCGVKAVALDKTGTITRGNFVVAKADCEDGFEEAELIELAAALEAKSTHPIAHAIVSAANGAYAADSMEEVAGCGVKGSVNGKTVLAGNSKHMKKENISYREHAERGTTVYVAVDGKYAGCIVIDDTIKPQSKEAVAMMKKHGLDVELLTGDNQASAAAVAKEVGIENVHASLMPGDKLDTLKKIRAEHGPVAFVGDGINDSVVLSGADVGCAMGAGGTDAAVEAADMVIMGDELTALPKAIDVSKRTMLIAKENVVFALAIKLIVMILGITGHAEMWMAVFADVGAALICVLNAVRLLPAKKAAK